MEGRKYPVCIEIESFQDENWIPSLNSRCENKCENKCENNFEL